jgi:hypothetical protein
MIVCSIVAHNYIGSVVALMRSVQANCPDVKCNVLLIDDCDDSVNKVPDEGIDWMRTCELGITNYYQWAFKYRLVEYATALKARYLQTLFEISTDKDIVYLDPDIIVYNDLSPVLRSLQKHPIVLTPHLDMDYIDDAWPDFNLMANNGVYNLGFIALRRSDDTDRLLQWWHQKLTEHCILEPWNGYFVDQRFMDFAPAFFPVEILKDVGCNVAYWNLHSRKLGKKDDVWTVNNESLQFFHFSGFHLSRPDILNNYKDIGRHLRPLHSDVMPKVDSLLQDYVSRLESAHFQEWRALPYSYSCFKDGTKVTDHVRRFYRIHPNRSEFGSDPFSSPALVKATKILAHKESFKNGFNCILGCAKKLFLKL